MKESQTYVPIISPIRLSMQNVGSSPLANTASFLYMQFIKLAVLRCEAVDRDVILCFTSRRGPYVTLTASLPRATLFHETHRNS